MKKLICGWVLGGLLGIATGCDKNSQDSTAPPSAESQLMQKGKVAYIANCTACHHRNPSQNGALGPPVAGSSLELLQLRLLEGKYPEGYVPKRNTRIMQPLPQFKNDIQALHAFLNQ